MAQVRGEELQVGDTVEVWWQPKRDTVVAFRPHTGALAAEVCGVRIADFALGGAVTITPDDTFEVIARGRA